MSTIKKTEQQQIPELTQEFLVSPAVLQTHAEENNSAIPELSDEIHVALAQSATTLDVEEVFKALEPQLKAEVKKAVLKELVTIEKKLTANIEQALANQLKAMLAEKIKN